MARAPGSPSGARPVVACVPNVSEGRDVTVLGACAETIRAVPGVTLADVHADPDHHRSVFTFLGEPVAVERATLALAQIVVDRVDMRSHRGVHPRVGALDVVPVVPLAGTTMDVAVTGARRLGRAIAERHAVPVYYYGAAARGPERALPLVRRGQYEGLAARLATPEGVPDEGPARFDARAGAVLVGARDVLVAYNVWLDTTDVEVARAIARKLRDPAHGAPALRALGLPLASRRCVQVSMSLLDYRITSIPAAFDGVQEEATARGVRVLRGELVGLAPRAAFAGRPPASVGVPSLRDDALLDHWLERVVQR